VGGDEGEEVVAVAAGDEGEEVVVAVVGTLHHGIP
jgi:hypothetical protein